MPSGLWRQYGTALGVDISLSPYSATYWLRHHGVLRRLLEGHFPYQYNGKTNLRHYVVYDWVWIRSLFMIGYE